MELKASRSRDAEAVVVEARLVQGQGPVATVIAKRGTLRPGQPIVVGSEWGKVSSCVDAVILRFWYAPWLSAALQQTDSASAAGGQKWHVPFEMTVSPVQVRALRAPHGGPLKEVLPGQPAEIIGLRGMPQAGDTLMVRWQASPVKLCRSSLASKPHSGCNSVWVQNSVHIFGGKEQSKHLAGKR